VIDKRRPLVAGNWKMHKTVGEAVALADAVVAGVGQVQDVDVLLCPPFTALWAVSRRIEPSRIMLGGQNCAFEREGAYTGEVSPVMLKDVGCNFVILGHSERRRYFAETDQNVNRKARLAIECGLCPIICLGETLDQRNAKETFAVVGSQLEGCLQDLSDDQVRKVTIAYEPVWAIGTGQTATPETAQEVQRFIRRNVADRFGDEVASAMRILYGGSVKPANAASLFEQPDIDGGLIGGASLDASAFTAIVNAARC